MNRRRLFTALTALSLMAPALGCGSKKEAPPAATPTPAAPAPTPTEAQADGPSATAPPAETAPADTEAPAPAPDPVAEVAAVDVVVWSLVDFKPKSTWLRVAGDEVTEVATRSEAVVFDGTTLWTIQKRWTHQDMMPCDALDDDAVEHKPSGSVELPSLVARPLGGDVSEKVVAKHELASGGFGDVASNDVSLGGSAGGVVLFERIDSGYGCGAHGYADTRHNAYDVAKGAEVEQDKLRAAMSDLAEKARGRLEAVAMKEECREKDRPLEADEVFLDGVNIERTGDDVQVVYHFNIPPEAEWAFNCEFYEDVPGPFRPETGLTAPSPAELKALAHTRASGIVGYATVTLTGDARDAALAAFKDASTLAPAEPKPAAAPRVADGDGPSVDGLVKEGRKATTEKRYDDAVKAFDAAIAKDPKQPRAWSGRGYARLLAGQLDLADTDFDKALLLDQGDAFQSTVWYNKGQLAEKRGDKEIARSHYETARSKKSSKAIDARIEALGPEPSR